MIPMTVFRMLALLIAFWTWNVYSKMSTWAITVDPEVYMDSVRKQINFIKKR